MNKKFSSDYWDQRYQEQQTAWDIGYVSTPLKDYFDQIKDKNLRILIPGAGNAWEVAYLYNKGFTEVYLLDFAPQSIDNFKSRNPDFPDDHIFCEDFFTHQGSYDLIIEHTFFSALAPEKRPEYVQKMHNLLHIGGKVAGLLFKYEFDFDGPPFGGSMEEYKLLFQNQFNINTMEMAYNSIKPRENRELFFKITKC